jgi:hypothetical protein
MKITFAFSTDLPFTLELVTSTLHELKVNGDMAHRAYSKYWGGEESNPQPYEFRVGVTFVVDIHSEGVKFFVVVDQFGDPRLDGLSQVTRNTFGLPEVAFYQR